AVYDKPLKTLLFSPEERMELVKQSFTDNPKIRVTGYSGLTVNACKALEAQVIMRGLRVFSDFVFEFRMALANHRLAPDIEIVSFITQEEHTFLSSTTVREIATLDGDISSMVPPHVEAALKRLVRDIDEHHRPAYAARD
ncbi:MAG: pantetheine-phosphate adenylyltransferase, partial [Anaerolineales bacterium]